VTGTGIAQAAFSMEIPDTSRGYGDGVRLTLSLDLSTLDELKDLFGYLHDAFGLSSKWCLCDSSGRHLLAGRGCNLLNALPDPWARYRAASMEMAERGITVSHTTIMRWVIRYVPEFERRWSRYARRVSPSWRMDETAVSVRGGRHYLYRAVDKYGRSVDSLLCSERGVGAAQAFFRKAVDTNSQRWPRKVNLDGYMATYVALRLLCHENPRWSSVIVRRHRYLNNIVEQDHRAIKRRCAPMLGLKSFRTAAITLSGVELAHRIRKRQYSFGRGGPSRFESLKDLWARAPA
jgi:transposase-like protein